MPADCSLEVHYETLKGLWEERFERRYGFWRGFYDAAVARYLDCGVPEAGFARLKCDACGSERLLTLSCKQRGICPSCDAKRAASFAAFLKDELVENASVFGRLLFQKCYDLISCATGSFWGSSLDSHTRPSRS